MINNHKKKVVGFAHRHDLSSRMRSVNKQRKKCRAVRLLAGSLQYPSRGCVSRYSEPAVLAVSGSEADVAVIPPTRARGGSLSLWSGWQENAAASRLSSRRQKGESDGALIYTIG